ncbi:MAG: hypothetical protein AAGE94_02605, partial [Acidobacteriota bacterium]
FARFIERSGGSPCDTPARAIAAIIAFFILLSVLLGAMQFASHRDPEPEELLAEHILPAPPPLVAAAPDGPETLDLGENPDLRPAVDEVVAGTLVVDLSMGEFILRPGPADEPLRVEADFDASQFELEETYSTDEDGRWTYNVKFGGKGGFFGMMFRGGANNPRNRVEIIVPQGHPIRLVGEVGMGESKMDLGGLWVEEVDLELGMGDHFMEVREPMPVPMKSFAVEASMGEIEIRGLGDASPEVVHVEHGMGDLFLDLQGAWRRDAEVTADFRMGQCRIWVPKSAHIELSGGSVSMGESSTRLPDVELPDGAPTVRLDASGSMGNLEIEY